MQKYEITGSYLAWPGFNSRKEETVEVRAENEIEATDIAREKIAAQTEELHWADVLIKERITTSPA